MCLRMDAVYRMTVGTSLVRASGHNRDTQPVVWVIGLVGLQPAGMIGGVAGLEYGRGGEYHQPVSPSDSTDRYGTVVVGDYFLGKP